MSEVFESTKQGLKEAIEFAEGKDNGARIFKLYAINVKKLSKEIGVNQLEFAAAF